MIAVNSIGSGEPSADATATPVLLFKPRWVSTLGRDRGLDVTWSAPDDGSDLVIPSWYIEEFGGDAPEVWRTLMSYPHGPSHGLKAAVWLPQFKDVFGGYCSPRITQLDALRDG